MTNIYNTASQTVTQNGTVILTNVANQKGCATTYVDNGIAIKKAGIYQITATVTGLVTAGGNITNQVLVNGVPVPYLIGTSYTDTGEPATVTVSGEVVVNPNCCAVTSNIPAIVTIVNTGTTTEIVSFASLGVVRID